MSTITEMATAYDHERTCIAHAILDLQTVWPGLATATPEAENRVRSAYATLKRIMSVDDAVQLVQTQDRLIEAGYVIEGGKLVPPLDFDAIGRQAVIGYLLAPYGHVLAVWPDGIWRIAPQNQTPEPREIRIPCPGRSVISGYAAEAAEALEAMMERGASAEQMHGQLDLTTWMDEIREKLEEAAAR